MKKTFQKWLVMLLLLTLVVYCVSACGKKSDDSTSGDGVVQEDAGTSQQEEEPYKIVFAYPGAPSGAGTEQMLAELNAYLKDKINVELEVLPIAAGNFAQQMNLMIAGNEKLDLYTSDAALGNIFISDVNQNRLIALDEYLPEYGAGLLEVMGEYLPATTVNGQVYAIPTLRDMASGYGVLVSKTALDATGIDPKSITTYEDFENVLATFKQMFPEKVTFATIDPSVSVWTHMINDYDPLGDYIGVLRDGGRNSLEVVNLFEDEDYIEDLKMIRRWYQEGYILPDITTNNMVLPMLISGELIACASNQRPGQEKGAESLMPGGAYAIQLGETLCTTQHVSNVIMCVPITCERPEKVVQFLDLLYTDPVVVNYLHYGVEGVHYVKTDVENVIAFPEGVDLTTSTYYGHNTSYFGNQLISYVWNTLDSTLWEDTKAFNENAPKSMAYGFVFDSSSVKNELTAVQNVLAQYRIPLEDGSVDLDTVLPEFQQALKDAGIDTIIEEKQRQLDAWAAENGK
ncbi:hypothetical protein B5F07_20210 [Lachnoclostridium sp. An169]|uniref:ABC transporter substrate-binding protein n=1 Tax=Lachnoclostridium sp. An169 TaxID=1965569 RepID=UPI000B37EB4D|nr:ABC transporter substrate-binding protein [Lachnoclostridium sp. An169]OUP80670.1 hypothetical protein B5F07_20210 [Lachnoclostridium sp. An169]